MQLKILEHMVSGFVLQDRREEQWTSCWDHRQVENCSIDSVQQLVLFSQYGATQIKGFKVFSLTEGTGDGQGCVNHGLRQDIWGQNITVEVNNERKPLKV